MVNQVISKVQSTDLIQAESHSNKSKPSNVYNTTGLASSTESIEGQSQQVVIKVMGNEPPN